MATLINSAKREYKGRRYDPFGRPGNAKDWMKNYFLSDKYVPTKTPASQFQIKDYELQHIGVDIEYLGPRPLYGVA